MNLRKIVMVLLLVSGLSFVASLDLNGLWDWQRNLVVLSSGQRVIRLRPGESWKPPLVAHGRDPFGNRREVAIPEGECTVSIQPLDDGTEQLAEIVDGAVACDRPGILHVQVAVALLSGASVLFAGDDQKSSWDQVLIVGDDAAAAWRRVDFAQQPEVVRRHLGILTRRESGGDGGSMYPWQPSEVVSNENTSLLVSAINISRGGTTRLSTAYLESDGQADRELPPPPKVRVDPKICLMNNRLILAGGNPPHGADFAPQVVQSFDLTNRTWSELPVLPEDVGYLEAAFPWNGDLAVYAALHDRSKDAWGATTLMVLQSGQWVRHGALKYDLRASDVFPLGTRLVVVETQQEHNTVKILEDGQLRTVAIADGYSSNAPVTVVADRLFQWTEDGVFELMPPP